MKSRPGMKETPEGVLLRAEREATRERKYSKRKGGEQREGCYFLSSSQFVTSDTFDRFLFYSLDIKDNSCFTSSISVDSNKRLMQHL